MGCLMKKWLVCLFAFCSLELAADVVSITGKLPMIDNHTYFVLSDGSCWKVAQFVKRWRSPLEWWRGVELAVPSNYESSPADWVLGTSVEVYLKQGNSQIDDADASNQDEIRQATHFLMNQYTGQVLFATLLHPADALSQAYGDGWNQGRKSGYSEGYLSGYNAGTEEGYKKGQNRENGE